MQDVDRYMENGVLILDKPKGISSFRAVETVKKRLGARKAGHTGTLDPMATGLLVVCLGRATKMARFLTDADKVYEGTLTLGMESDTYDMEGEILNRQEVPSLDRDRFEDVASVFVGELEQAPPAYSAAKHRGQPLYKLARKGIRVEKEAKRVRVYEFSILDYVPPVVSFRVHCSKGTYVRSLVHDFGRVIGCGAVLSSLRRLKSGLLSVDEAIHFDLLKDADIHEIMQKILPVELVLSHIPFIVVNNRDAQAISQGRQMSLLKTMDYMQEQLPNFRQLESEYLRVMFRDRDEKMHLVCVAKWPNFDGNKGFLEILRVWNAN